MRLKIFMVIFSDTYSAEYTYTIYTRIIIIITHISEALPIWKRSFIGRETLIIAMNELDQLRPELATSDSSSFYLLEVYVHTKSFPHSSRYLSLISFHQNFIRICDSRWKKGKKLRIRIDLRPVVRNCDGPKQFFFKYCSEMSPEKFSFNSAPEKLFWRKLEYEAY